MTIRNKFSNLSTRQTERQTEERIKYYKQLYECRERKERDKERERERSDFPVHFSPYDLRFILPTFLKGFRRAAQFHS
jgi:hypothetical protein